MFSSVNCRQPVLYTFIISQGTFVLMMYAANFIWSVEEEATHSKTPVSKQSLVGQSEFLLVLTCA